jgi:hypothetical protein
LVGVSGLGEQMRHYDPDHYLNTPHGLLAQYRRRRSRRIHFRTQDVEPRAKGSMPNADKDKLQSQLIQCLTSSRRRAFRSAVALRITLATTNKTPTHPHHIAKNLLDLFAVPSKNLPTRRRSLLYGDDSQVHALAVTCHHGKDTSEISVTAHPLEDFLHDLELLAQCESRSPEKECFSNSIREFELATEAIRDIQDNRDHYLGQFGEPAVEALLRIHRQDAQQHLLYRAALTPLDIAALYNVSGRAHDFDQASMWETVFHSSPLRIRLNELPQERGASTIWIKEVEEKLKEFKDNLGWLMDPLMVPVALEVVIKPPPPSRLKNRHDIDNVLRDYLIPGVVRTLKPISHHAFMFEKETLERVEIFSKSNPRLAYPHSSFSKPPVSTRRGLSRYEVWQLPSADEGSKGYVSVAIVPDLTGYGDVFGQIDDEVEAWVNSVD